MNMPYLLKNKMGIFFPPPIHNLKYGGCYIIVHEVICGRIILYLGKCFITFLLFLSSDRRLIFTYTRMYIKPASFFFFCFLWLSGLLWA